MKYVYLLESINCPGETYIGMTDDLRTRVSTHNSGQAKHTSKLKPWSLVTYLGFSDPEKTVAFERYLKSSFRTRIREQRTSMAASERLFYCAVADSIADRIA
jgi:predicted GIY-YIG superfamily endonuclease